MPRTVTIGDTRTPAFRTAIYLLGLAIAVRLVVVALSTKYLSMDSAQDVVFQTQLVGNPLKHFQQQLPEVAQYPPLLGFLQWITYKPWIGLGFSATTALRLGAVAWDLLGMVLLMLAAAKHFPHKLRLTGLIWGLAPLFWPASAFGAQDELVAAAFVAGIVLLFLNKRIALALIVAVVGVFAAKIFLIPVVLALLVGARKESVLRLALAVAGVSTSLIIACEIVSGTNGISQQIEYSTDIIGFSISLWSTSVLHHWVGPDLAYTLSLAILTVVYAGLIALFLKERQHGHIDSLAMMSALLFSSFAILVISNPEYLCIGAPAAIVAALGMKDLYQNLKLVLLGIIAWSINAVYFLLRSAYDNGERSLLDDGFIGEVSRRIRILDVSHQFLLLIYLYLSVLFVCHFLPLAKLKERGEQREFKIATGSGST